ncbi:MAG: CHAT domain-containing protein, partial [Gammaproteobacteria bacterium]|nr:CHAT domain-containing protein [Gammaproteobacteria bacterium]
VEVQKLLDPNIALVEYYVTEERTLVFIITQQSFEHDEIAVNRDNLLQYIQTARVPSEQSHPEVLQTLYRWLFAESVAEYFDTDIQAIGFVPHDLLHYLPFAALSDGEKHLIDNYALFTLPSVSVLRYLPEKRKSTIETVLALGNPDVTRPGLTKLEFAAQEAIHVGNLYNTQAFINADATESIFWSKASDAGIVHLAAHGIYNRYNPLFSTIYLTGNDEGDSHGDGQLQVHEIYGLDLRSHTDLVVLSACDSAVGDLSSGDEIVSLNRALLYAGTPTVLASLWKVDDKPTYLLMKHFHDNLKGGMSKATALRLAQQEVRKDYPSPYYWAGFVLTGDGGNIEAGPTSNTEQDDSLGTATDT